MVAVGAARPLQSARFGMSIPSTPTRHLARLTFIAFLLTFIAARTLVILIMTRKVPDLFPYLGGTHVHHLNYGIFLLATVAAVLLFAPLNAAQRSFCALVYGVGMALTFDEFGIWLHLGGSYWQRASFDAVVVVLSVFALRPGGKRGPKASHSVLMFSNQPHIRHSLEGCYRECLEDFIGQSTCAVRSTAWRRTSALWSKPRRSSSDIAGSRMRLTPSRPTTLGNDRVTPYLAL